MHSGTYDDDQELRRELEHAAYNLMSAGLDGRYRVDGALNVLQQVLNRISSCIGGMEPSPSNIAEVDRAIADVRHYLERASDDIYQAVSRFESAL
jgi:hypothetical protein